MIAALLMAQVAMQPVPKLQPVAPARQRQQQPGVDFSKLPIEDAVTLMFGLIADDAREDTRAMLEEMQQARMKRSAMREAQDEMNRELQRLKAVPGNAALAKVNPTAASQRQWANQLTIFCGKLSGETRSQCLESAVRKRTVQLRSLPSPKQEAAK